MILTDEEIGSLFDNHDQSWRGFARAIEAAVLEKLKAQSPVGVIEVVTEDGKTTTPTYSYPNVLIAEAVAAEREACIEDVRTVGGEFSVECESLIRARGAV